MDADTNEQQGRWDQAEKDYRKILEQNPRYPGIHFRLARLLLSKIDHEKFSLYQNNRDETFDDKANATPIGASTRLMSGWGLKFFDYDNDGNLDLFLANGNPTT